MNWRESSACSGNTEHFFPYHEQAAGKAKAICETCPVLQACFDFATDARIPHGVFGGEDGVERRSRLQIDSVGRPLSLWMEES